MSYTSPSSPKIIPLRKKPCIATPPPQCCHLYGIGTGAASKNSLSLSERRNTQSKSLCYPDYDGVHFCLGPCTIRVGIGQWCSMVEAFSVRLLGSYSSRHSPLLFFIFGSPTLWILQTSHDVTHWGKVGSSSGDYTLLAGAGFGLAMAWFCFLIYSPLAGSCL